MKGITLCAECAYYSMKKHKCTRGATDTGEPTARFYADCPLDDIVHCRDCKYCDPESMHCDHPMGTALPVSRKLDDFCSYGERKEDD